MSGVFHRSQRFCKVTCARWACLTSITRSLYDSDIAPSASFVAVFVVVVVVGVVVAGISFLAFSAASARMLPPVISMVTE